MVGRSYNVSSVCVEQLAGCVSVGWSYNVSSVCVDEVANCLSVVEVAGGCGWRCWFVKV